MSGREGEREGEGSRRKRREREEGGDVTKMKQGIILLDIKQSVK